MPTIYTRDGERVKCSEVTATGSGWVVADIPGECVQHIPRSNVSRILSESGVRVRTPEGTGAQVLDADIETQPLQEALEEQRQEHELLETLRRFQRAVEEIETPEGEGSV